MTGPVLIDPETGEKVTTKLPLGDVKVGLRHRTEFGDIRELADSIRAHGLLNPISVTADHRLIAGHRRLEAVKLLGVADIPVRVIRSVDSAVEMLQAERDENVCRKDMNASELYALGKELERLERPIAAANQGRRTDLATSRPDGPEVASVETRDVVGAGLGMSARTWGRLKHLGDKASEGDAAAKDELARVDAGTETIGSAYRKVTTTTERIKEATTAHPVGKSRVTKAQELADLGYTSGQIADEIGISRGGMTDFRKRHGVVVPADSIPGASDRMADPDRIVREVAMNLDGLASAVARCDINRVRKETVAEWADSLEQSLSALNRFRRDLTKESTRA